MVNGFSAVSFRTHRGKDAKRHSFLRLIEFGLFRNIVDKLSLNLRNILISRLEGEKKFLSELGDIRNFKEGFNLKRSCRNSNSDRRLYFLKNINYNSDMLHHDKNNKGRLGILAQREAGFEPSPAFVMLTGVRKRLLPLTKREGSDSVISNNYSDTNHSQLTTHYSLISDTVFSRFTSPFLHKRTAFTLAEVLITLGIIGIVAAMTLPSVISKYQEKQTVTQLNATYSLLSQAIERMVDDNGDISTYGDDERTRVTTLFLMLQNYIQTTKVCPHNYKGCFDASPFSSLNYGYVLKNGVAIRLINGGTCEQDTTMDKTGGWELNPNVKGTHYGTYHHSCAYMYININGNTNAKLGKNTFLFAVVQNGIVPVGGPKESTSYNNISNCLNGQDMSECGAWIIYNKNMDYLHCPEQLGWDKATHCK